MSKNSIFFQVQNQQKSKLIGYRGKSFKQKISEQKPPRKDANKHTPIITSFHTYRISLFETLRLLKAKTLWNSCLQISLPFLSNFPRKSRFPECRLEIGRSLDPQIADLYSIHC